MSSSFDILNRNQPIHSSLALEASAGTGKTFSIEHLVVRLLIEEGLSIDAILVVTFTRAATQELKERIWKRLQETLHQLEKQTTSAPDYVQVLYGDQKAKRQILKALHLFDQAQIFTLHSFCDRILREEGEEMTSFEEKKLGQKEVKRVIRDFIRTELTEGLLTTGQLNILLRSYRHNVGSFEAELSKLMFGGKKIESQFSLSSLLEKFQAAREHFNEKNVCEHLSEIALSYKGICDKEGKRKPGITAAIEKFSQLFDLPRWGVEELNAFLLHDQLLTETLVLENRKKAAGEEKNPFILKLQKKLIPLLQEASSKNQLLAAVACSCQKHLMRYKEEEEKITPDDLLQMVKSACQSEEFIERVSKRFEAVIIDECQDTDPLQWEIVQTLFPKEKTRLYLVGDPKQSIYAFRNADLYSYLKAVKQFEEKRCFRLSVNWRSNPSLVSALNHLFSEGAVPEIFHLPKLSQSISSPKVSAGRENGVGGVHFFITSGKMGRARKWPTEEIEERELFPYIAHEIFLKKKEGVSFQNWAILVRDRFQAERFARYCKQKEIPTINQRQLKLVESPAWKAFRDVLAASIEPEDRNLVKISLGGALFRWSAESLETLKEPACLAKILYQFRQYHEALFEGGIATLFENLSEKIEEELFLDVGRQVTEWLVEEERTGSFTPSELLHRMGQIDLLDCDLDSRLLQRQNQSQDAVQILTMHMSKGLEFEYVVALGLASRTPSLQGLVPEGETLSDKEKDSEEAKKYLEEIDAEKMRQLYVAMTRAKEKLYVPVCIPPDRKSAPPLGTASPMELYLAHLKKGWGKERAEDDVILLKSYLSRCPAITYSECSVDENYDQIKKEKKELFAPEKMQLINEQRWVQSFTSLAKPTEIEFSDKVPHDLASEEKTPHTLPAGASTGIMMHYLMEKIPFDLASEGKEAIREFILPLLTNSVYKNWSKTISEMIYRTLTLPISISGNNFILADVSSERCFKEVEFYFSKNKDAVTGIIDCAFEINGKYVLLDWKTNWLGNSPKSYSSPFLGQSMKQHDYFLQAKLYQEAFDRYLSNFGNVPIAGTIYLFMRGPSAYILENEK